MLILGLLGMYFDAAVVFVTNSSLLFRLAVAILCPGLTDLPNSSSKICNIKHNNKSFEFVIITK